jgi:sirohydrochlorin cobaltochelatase
MVRARIASLALLLSLTACGVRPVNPAATTPAHRTGLLIIAHGATPAWNDAVRATAAEVRWQGPVETAFLMGPEAVTSGWDAAVARLESAGVSGIVVVPLMVSSAGSHFRQVQHYAGLRVAMPSDLGDHAHAMRAPTVPARVTAALDASPEMVAIVADRWRGLPDAECTRPVLVLGHGPNDSADALVWTDQLRTIGAGLVTAGLHGELRTAMLRDDAPAPVRAAAVAAMRDTITALAARRRDSVVVLAVVIAASSAVTDVRIPADLAGLPVRYVTAPMAPSALLARWIERVATR